MLLLRRVDVFSLRYAAFADFAVATFRLVSSISRAAALLRLIADVDACRVDIFATFSRF